MKLRNIFKNIKSIMTSKKLLPALAAVTVLSAGTIFAEATQTSSETIRLRAASAYNRSLVQDETVKNLNPFENYSAEEKAVISEETGLENAIKSAMTYDIETWNEKIDAMNEALPKDETQITGTYSGIESNTQRIIRVMDYNGYNEIFPVRRETYSYRGFLEAAVKYPTFCGEKNDQDATIATKSLDQVCKRELSSMFAHFAQEVGAHVSGTNGTSPIPTSALNGNDNQGIVHANNKGVFPKEEWKQGLYWLEEISHAGATTSGYALCEQWQGAAFPCGDANGNSVSYHGRGAKQLSWNYNYGPFSMAMYGDNTLLEQPELVAQDGKLALGSAFWFYMTPRSPKPSIHETVVGHWQPSERDKKGLRQKGFGVQTMIINGGLECGGADDRATAANRQNYFEGLSKHFGVNDWYPASETKDDCRKMLGFENDTSSPYFYKGYYTKGWDGSGECILVNWEASGFSPFNAGDWEACNASPDGATRYFGTDNKPATKPEEPNTPDEPAKPEYPTNPVIPPAVDPTPPASDNGTAGSGSVDKGLWSENVIYLGEDTVKYKGFNWKAGWWTMGDLPGSHPVWKKQGTDEDTAVTPPANDDTPVMEEPELPVFVETDEDIDPTKNTTWSSVVIYNTGDTVFFNDNEYEAKWWILGAKPSLEEPVWKLISGPEADNPNWHSSKIYLGGDTVIYNGKEYKAKWWTQNNKPGTNPVWELIG